MAEDRWAYCEKCKELFLLDIMQEGVLHDVNQKVMNPNNEKRIMLCPDCLSSRKQASVTIQEFQKAQKK